ncbi:MAG: DUF3606 domain-containing protein [Variovorax sp.]|nr:MAG: DUF3606 domain-containing protein [Variovorax sp.]
MADDLHKRGPRDRASINVNEEHELQYWMKEFDVTEEKLRMAVAEVGTSVAGVKDHLGLK